MKHELDPTTLTQPEIYAIEARRYKAERTKTAYQNYEKASPARKASMRKYSELHRYRQACLQLTATASLVMTPQEQETLRALTAKVSERLKGESHSFVVCPSCYHALNGKPPTKRFSKFTSTRCACCGAQAEYTANNLSIDTLCPSNLYIRSKFTRTEAINHIHTHHPELFV